MSEYTYKDVIIDPEDPRVEIGKEYYFACTIASLIAFANGDCSARVLESIQNGSNYPFTNGIGNYMCIIRKKEPKYVPFDLSDSEVRKSLRGKWIKNKDNHFEICITDFSHQGHVGNTIRADIYRANDMEADELLNYWMFDDGSPCGKLVEEE